MMAKKRPTSTAQKAKRAREARFHTLFRLCVGVGKWTAVIGDVYSGGRVEWRRSAGRRRPRG